MILRTVFLTFLYLFTANAQDGRESNVKPKNANNVNAKSVDANNIASNVQNMTAFAKNALITNTNLAKNEWDTQDEEIIEETPVQVEEKYKATVYRDVFFTTNESALLNQAIEYFAQGKKMYSEAPVKRFRTQKVEKVREPLVRLSSIIYKNNSMWAVFTNIGKFSNSSTSVGGVQITGISKDEVEFQIEADSTFAKIETQERVQMQNDVLILTLRTGECIFKEEMKITKSCRTITEMVDKEIEVK